MGVIGNVSEIRPSRLRVRDLKSRELDAIRTIMARFLKTYGLKLKNVTKEALIAIATHPEARMGFLQRELRYPLTLMHGVGAAAVAASGLGLGKTDVNKRMVDRSAAGVQGVGLNEILSSFNNRMAIVAAAEGERVKPGEKGGNPARFRGQASGLEELRVNIDKILDGDFERDVQIVYVVSDDVDGTGKATQGLHSSVTASVYTQSRVRPLPDEYMIKVVSRKSLPPHITTESSAKEIVEEFAIAHGIPKTRLNLFALIRPRHDQPVQEIADLGPNFIMDKDGDVMPAIAAAIGRYIFENGYPLHGIVANIGGAAEAGLLIPVVWRGGSAVVEFASKSGLKSNNWEDRRNFSEKEKATITEYGFKTHTPYNITELYEDPYADGIGVYGGITDNLHVEATPDAGMGLAGVKFGIEGVMVHSLQISSNGRAEILHALFEYQQSEKATKALLTPYLTTLLNLGGEREVNEQVAKMMAENAMRLKTEFGQEYYLALGVKQDRFEMDEATYESLRTEGKTQRFTAIDDAIIAAVRNQQPDWFV